MCRLKNDVRCVAPVVRQQHLLHSFPECNPSLLWDWLADGHTETQTSVTKSVLCKETHRRQMGVWTLRAHDEEEMSGASLSIWKREQFRMTHL